jgi:hypothetical protein
MRDERPSEAVDVGALAILNTGAERNVANE